MRPTRRMLLAICVVVVAGVAACAKGVRDPETDGPTEPPPPAPAEDSERRGK